MTTSCWITETRLICTVCETPYRKFAKNVPDNGFYKTYCDKCQGRLFPNVLFYYQMDKWKYCITCKLVIPRTNEDESCSFLCEFCKQEHRIKSTLRELSPNKYVTKKQWFRFLELTNEEKNALIRWMVENNAIEEKNGKYKKLWINFEFSKIFKPFKGFSHAKRWKELQLDDSLTPRWLLS